MKRIVIFGASGNVGQHLCYFSLKRGYETVAVDKIHSNTNNLINGHNRIEKLGDVKDYSFVNSLLKKRDLIVYSVRNKENNSWKKDTSLGIINLIKASNQIPISRIIYIAGAGILKVKHGGLRGEKRISKNLKPLFREHLKSYILLKESNLNWTIICPPKLCDIKTNKEIRWKVAYLPKNDRPISYEAVAKFALNILKTSDFSKKRIGICF